MFAVTQKGFFKSFLLLFAVILFIAASLPVKAQVISTYAGNGAAAYGGDGGPATSASFNNPIGIAMDGQGNTYVAEYYSCRVRKIDKLTGIITTVAGNGTPGFSGDGGPAINAEMNNPSRIAVNNAGDIFICDNQNFRIRKVTASTGIITTIAGDGTSNYAPGGPATSSGMRYPYGIALDQAGNVYFSQFPSNYISKIDAVDGIITTVAGNGMESYVGDGGPAVQASFGAPAGLCVDAAGNIYVADISNNCIREIFASTGYIATIAGNGIPGFRGDGGPAFMSLLQAPSDVFVDAAGNIFISDRGNDRVREITSTGIITTIAGNGQYGYGGDGASPTGACVKLADPITVITDPVGNIYFCDQSNSRIRKISPSTGGPGTTIQISTPSSSICAGAPTTFMATVMNPGSALLYQWKINGVNAGTNSASFTTSSLKNSDVVSCELTSTACSASTVVSNTLAITVNTSVVAAVVIQSNNDIFCTGTAAAAIFTAVPTGAGSSPSFQWKINGVNAGTNNPGFNINSLSNGDVVSCTMTSNAACAINATATSNNIVIKFQPVDNPTVAITTSDNGACPGSLVVLHATAHNPGDQPNYAWKVNGVDAGTNSADFGSTTFQTGDMVTCTLTSNAPCVNIPVVVSNSISISIASVVIPTLTITSLLSDICAGTPVTFFANATNASNNLTYQWQVNGVAAGTDSNAFISTSLAEGDLITCLLTDNNSVCAVPILSANALMMTVRPAPIISIEPADTAISLGSTFQLLATVSGTISNLVWTPATGLSNNGIANPMANPRVTTTYKLFAQDANGCATEKSVVVTVLGKFAMPDSFTPNGDGHNDVFRIPPSTLFTLESFYVFDRWGNKVFESRNAGKGWDGTYKGKPCDAGTYVYMISGSVSKKAVMVKGTVVLVR